MRTLRAATLVLVTAAADLARAHGDEQHAAPAASTASVSAGQRTLEAVSDRHEVVLKHAAADVKRPLALHLFVSDWATNEPRTGASVRLTVPDLQLDIEAVESAGVPGLYELTATPGIEGTHAGIVSIRSAAGDDLLALNGITFGPDPSTAPAVRRVPSFLRIAEVAIGVIVAFGLILVARMVLARRRRTASAGLAALLAASAWGLAGGASAHGGEDHGAAPGGALGTVAVMPKEAQFLFGIRTEVARVVPLSGRRRLRGTVMTRPDGRAEVIATQPGRVLPASRPVPTVGDRVEKGQPLLVVEGTLSPEAKLAAASELTTARSRRIEADDELRVAEREWERVVALPQVMSQRERDAAQAHVSSARARADAAAKDVALRESSAAGGASSAMRVVLTSPIDGIVSEGHVTLGEMAEPGHVFFTVIDAETPWIRVSVPESDSAFGLPLGAAADAVSPASPGRTIRAVLHSRSPALDPASRTATLFFTADNRDAFLLEGMLVDVLVVAGGTVEGVVVPSSAIVDVAGKAVAFVKVHAEEFSPRDVVLGLADGDRTEILGGLVEGERVVVAGAFQLRSALLASAR